MRGNGKIFVLVLIIVILVPNEILVFAWSIVPPTRELNIAQGGYNLDLFTQKGGIGPLAPSDAFAPEELLILYSNVTYNDSPVPDQWVTFEVCDAAGNISADLGNYTDASGIATTSFRLPSSGFPLAEDPNVFGIWTVTSAAEWGGNVSSDSLTFKCGWLVKIVSVEPGTYVNGEWYSKTIFHKLEALEVMVTLTSICFSSQNIYLSVDYFDAQGYPFFDNGLWYNKTGGTTERVAVCLDRIPTSIRVGTATLQATVASRPVDDGGVALCPSVSNLTVISSLQWWNHNWNRRVRVEICDNSGSSQTMLPVEVTFEHGGNSLPDGSDIRVVAENSQIPCNIISINGTHATVGFAIDLSAFEARTIFIYYGNPGLSSSGVSSASSKDPEGSAAESSELTIVIIPDTIVVPDDFPNLQQAINHANAADTVFARKGTYYGTVLLNNSVVLVGESVTQTILDGGSSGNVTEVTKNSVTVADLTIRNSWNQAPSAGIVLNKVENCAIRSVNIIGCYYGISLFNSGGNDLDANNITRNTEGIYLFDSSGCRVSDNVFANNGVAICSDASSNNNGVYENHLTNNTLAIEIASSSDNAVSENTITQNFDGVKIAGADANNNTLRRNDITNNSQFGVGLFSSQGNTITENNIGLNEYGVWLNGANNNTFFYNNFTGNPTQVFVEVQSSGNTWDNGYPWGGNYWSNISTADALSGPNQNEAGSDGIADTPYVIGANNLDNYPLMNSWTPPDIAVTNLTSAKTVIGQGYTGLFNVNFENLGNKIEAFNATVYANSTCAYSVPTMLAMTNYTLSFTFNTTGVAYGNYTITASAEFDPNENATTNNCTCSAIVTIPGDINGDFKVGLSDLSLLAKAYGSTPGTPKWNPNADLYEDGKVGLSDLSILAKHYGQHYP
jgi:parallel beta-helix repeat protein